MSKTDKIDDDDDDDELNLMSDDEKMDTEESPERKVPPQAEGSDGPDRLSAGAIGEVDSQKNGGKESKSNRMEEGECSDSVCMI